MVHCLVSNIPSSNGSGTTQQASTRSGVHDHLLHYNQGAAHGHHHQIHHGQALDVSAFFIPLLGLALAMVWYLAIAYNSYFNFMSTVAPVLKIRFGPPNADFWSVWSSQKARKLRQIQPTTKVHILCFDCPLHIKNIAKGTTDPRVEFILPKSYCKFKHKS